MTFPEVVTRLIIRETLDAVAATYVFSSMCLRAILQSSIIWLKAPAHRSTIESALLSPRKQRLVTVPPSAPSTPPPVIKIN